VHWRAHWLSAQGATARRTFSALDAKVRKELRDWLRRIHDELHVTTVLVTHDQKRRWKWPTRGDFESRQAGADRHAQSIL